MRARSWMPLTGAAALAALAAGALTNVLYARVLGAEDLGRIAVLYALATVIILVGDGGLQLFVTRAVQNGTLDRPRAAAVLVFAVPGLAAASWAVFALMTTAATAQWEGLALGFEYTALLGELVVSMAFFQVSLTLTQAFGLFDRRSALIVGNGWLTTAFTAAALAIFDSVTSAIHATAAAYALVAAVGIVPVVAKTSVRAIPFRQLWQFGREARPLWLNSAITYLGSAGDILLAALLLPLSAVGYYRVFKAAAAVVLAPLFAILTPLYAQLASLTDDGRAEIYARVRRASLGLMAALLVASAPFLSWAISIAFGRSFSLEIASLVGLIVSFAFAFHHYLLGIVNTAAGAFKRPLVINGAVFATAAIAAPTLSSFFGLEGFVIASVSANFAGLVAGSVVTAVAVRRSFANLVLWPTATLLTAGGIAIWLQELPMVPAAIVGAVLASMCGFAALAPRSTYSSLNLFRHRPDAARAR